MRLKHSSVVAKFAKNFLCSCKNSTLMICLKAALCLYKHVEVMDD